MSKKLGHDDMLSLYVVILFLMFLIAIVSMCQNRRIDLLRKDIEALKRQTGIASEQPGDSRP